MERRPRLDTAPPDGEYAFSAAPLVPDTADLAAVRDAAAACRACHLWRRATQTVFGEGPPKARLMLIGEQPGDREDRAGRPFVGPAGRLLDQALEEAGIDRSEAYVTNVVKHFKHEERGSRRLHRKPDGSEIGACRPWLEAELRAVQPEVVVCLGATAAQALLGRSFRITRSRGEFFAVGWCRSVMATVHPSSLLRIEDDEERRAAREAFAADLRRAAERLAAPALRRAA